jgi:hypothetical protein
LVVPLAVGAGSLASGLASSSPDLYLALMLQAVASPMMASPSLAALLDLDATLVLVTLVTSTALVPITASLFAYAFFGAALSLSPLALGLKLAAMLAGSLLAAVAIRWKVGRLAIERHRLVIDGINIVVLLVFVAAVMGNVAGSLLADPVRTAELGLLAFAIFFALMGITLLLFRAAGPERALALALMVSQRKHGADAGRHRRRAARHDLALFCDVSIPDLSVAPAPQTGRAPVAGASTNASCFRKQAGPPGEGVARAHQLATSRLSFVKSSPAQAIVFGFITRNHSGGIAASANMPG